MILEETVIFSEESDASEFIAFLKSRGCRCRREVRGIARAEEVLAGPLDGVIAWFGQAAALNEDEFPDDARWFREGEEKYRQSRERIAALLEGREPGDILYTARDLDRAKDALLAQATDRVQSWLEEMGEGVEPDESSLLDKLLENEDGDVDSEDYPFYIVHWMLKRNGVVVETPEGFRLQRQIAAGEVVMEVSPENMPAVDLPDAPSLNRKISYGLEPVYVVAADPTIHFAFEPDEVLSLLEVLEVEPENFRIVEENLAGKQVIISSLIEAVGRQPGISVDELAGRLTGETVDEEGLLVVFEAVLDRNMIATVVSELRKQGVLAGTDQKIRLAVKTSGRKKRR